MASARPTMSWMIAIPKPRSMFSIPISSPQKAIGRQVIKRFFDGYASMATYSSSGVDIRKVKGMHTLINDAIFQKLPNYVLPIKGHYAGVFRSGKETLAVHCDGVGSKVLVAGELGKFDTVGIDCVAMNVNDLICVGARPRGLVDY